MRLESVFLLLAMLAIPIRFVETVPDATRMLLPIEVVGMDGTTVSRTLELSATQSESVTSLWLQVHGLRYATQASVHVNEGPWTPLNNDTVSVAAAAKAFGGIGGGFSTVSLTVPLPKGSVTAGANTIAFRFNHSDGLSSGYRVLAWNFLSTDGSKIIPSTQFAEDTPERWTPPLPDAASIQAGKELWHSAALVGNSLRNRQPIKAHCADCHAQDGRDLKYFNFSNESIETRSRFHGLSALQGEQIASYIRSLPVPNPGRPWNPPYQPGPGLDAQPLSNWAAGAGLTWVLDNDADALQYLLAEKGTPASIASVPVSPPDLRYLAAHITPELFRPDGDLNTREVPIAMQLPDWSQWLPRIHPKDAWGLPFVESDFATIYDGGINSGGKSKREPKSSLRTQLAVTRTRDSAHSIVPLFVQWSKTRRNFLGHVVPAKVKWTPELADRVYSTQLWQVVKTWEVTQEFGLEARGRDFVGPTAELRTWCNTVPADTAPAETHIPDAVGVGGSALTNVYLSASWYELQILLNSGNHRHRDRTPVDWVYLIGQFRDLYLQSHNPEPVRLLVAVTKSLQSTDVHAGPVNYSEGWRPERNIDPRIIINSKWAPLFEALPSDVRRVLTQSLLRAWMNKTLQYPIADYLPVGVSQHGYSPRDGYSDISGGKVWEAAEQFRAAGVSDDLVKRLQNWGKTYTDRAARVQYR